MTWLVYLAVVGGLSVYFLAFPIVSQATRLLLNDPDNYQRLVEVRDWLNGQSWWDTRQYRINPPAGLQMHWSRLADVPLASFILVFSLFTDYATAEMLAVVIMPPLLLLLMLVLLGRAARNVGGVPAQRFVQLFILATSFVLAQFIPGRIDHHGLQLVLLAGALAAATARPNFQNGMLLSLATSLSLLVGLEMVPLLLAIIGWVVLEWLAKGEMRHDQLRGVLAGMLFYLPLLYALSVSPLAWGRLTHDEIGIGHLVTIVAGTGTLAITMQVGRGSVRARIISAALAVCATAFTVLMFPGMLAPPYAAIDPNLAALWIEEIAETQSAFDIAVKEPARLLHFHLFPALALLTGTLVYFMRGRPTNMLPVLLAGLSGLILCLWQVRATGGAALVALLLSAASLAHLRERRNQPFGLVVFCVGLISLNGLFGPALYHSLVPAEQQKVASMDEARLSARCERFLLGDGYNDVPAGLVLNGIDSGAIILARTHHSVLAAGSHRAEEGNATAYRLFLTPSSEARFAMAQRNIDYLLTCRDGELWHLAEHAPDSLAADLFYGRVPEWLQPLPHKGGDKVLFFATSRRETVSGTPRTGQPSK